MPRSSVTSSPVIDCLVVGGGPAGLAAATQLGRLRRSTVLVDDEAGRSLWSQVTRNHLGFPGGVSAADLRLLGKEQASAFEVILRNGEVTGLRHDPGTHGGFIAMVHAAEEPVADADMPGLATNRDREHLLGTALGERSIRRATSLRARTVLLAVGVRDAFPSFPGRDECVGVSLFWCIICDGFEASGRHVVVVGDDEEAIETAFGLLHFTRHVSLVTGRSRTRASADRLRELEGRGVAVYRAGVATYRHVAGQIQAVELVPAARIGADPTAPPVIDCEMVFVSTPKRPRTILGRRLKARVDQAGYLMTDDAGRTSVSGLYAAGDATAGHSHQVTTAAHLGATAATAVNYDLYDEVERGESPATARSSGRRRM